MHESALYLPVRREKTSFLCLQVIGAPTLFATHFHELTAINGPVGVKNSHMQTNLDLQSNKLTMLYNVVDGVCDQSFGIHVAEFAGFPQEVIDNAKNRLAKLEAGGLQSKQLQVCMQTTPVFPVSSQSLLNSFCKSWCVADWR